MSAFGDFYRETVERLAPKLESFNDALAKESQPVLQPIMADVADLNAGGKMLRGVLVDLGYRLAGHRKTDYADDAALAFEIFQTGVLIHDDIIDRATYRRGRKTLPVRYRESLETRHLTPPAEGDTRASVADGVALCAGDYLISAATRHLAEAYGTDPRAAEVIAEFSAVILETIRGEMLDVMLPCEVSRSVGEEDEPGAGPDAESGVGEEAVPGAGSEAGAGCGSDGLLMRSVNDIYRMKTARYSVVGPLHLGLLLGGADEAMSGHIDRIGREIGIAFQIKDDLLGIFGDERTIGKDVGSDIAECKQTILYAYVMEKKPAYIPRLLEVYGKADVTPDVLREVRAVFEESGAKAFAETAMEEHFAAAGEILESLSFDDENNRTILRDFIDYNRKRKK